MSSVDKVGLAKDQEKVDAFYNEKLKSLLNERDKNINKAKIMRASENEIKKQIEETEINIKNIKDDPDNYVEGSGNGKIHKASDWTSSTGTDDKALAREMGPDQMKQVLVVSTFAKAGATMKIVQNALEKVSTMRSKLGATQNRLEHTIANLDTTSENTSAAESRIRDTDMAKEMVTYSKNNILQQAGQSMLAQANQSTQGVLSILG